MKTVVVVLVAGLMAVAALGGVWMGLSAPENGATADVTSEFEARLVELGLTEEQIDDTIVRGVETFIARQQQAQMEAQQQQQAAAAERLRPASVQDDYIRGAEDATFTMIEYSDYECPFCK
ncbi:MAG: hypothetical protein WED11_12725, partial [Natronospirillum sp.]